MELDSSQLELAKATLLGHQYELIRLLGSGGFSVVTLVRSTRYDREFAAKLIRLSGIKGATTEIDTLMKVSGPNIINMYEHFDDDIFLYIIFEYCPGGTLTDFIKKNGSLPENELYKLCGDLIRALKKCHDRMIAHRDIKPDNILIDLYGRPKLTDFGLSQIYLGEKEESTFAGSRAFMSPEIISKTAHNPFEADIWALGITFYYFAFGNLPWTQDSLKNLELQIKMGMITFPKSIKVDPSFLLAIRKMTHIRPKMRATLDWLLEFDIFKYDPEKIDKCMSTTFKPITMLPPIPPIPGEEARATTRSTLPALIPHLAQLRRNSVSTPPVMINGTSLNIKQTQKMTKTGSYIVKRRPAPLLLKNVINTRVNATSTSNNRDDSANIKIPADSK